MLKKIISIIISSMMLFCGCENQKQEEVSTVEPETYPDFQVTFLDIGKADSMILKTQNHTVIIDCGEKKHGKDIVNYLEESNISTVDYLILTHYDKDHIGGVSKVIKNVEISNIIAPNYIEDSNEFEKYSETATEYNIIPQILTQDLSFALDDVEFTIYPPQKDYYGKDDDNDFSLVVSVTHKDNNFLFTGDAMELRIEEILDLNLGTFDFLKVPYHGRSLDNFSSLIDSVKPKYAVISTSEDYLSSDITNILNKNSVETYITYLDGQITLTSDGVNIFVDTENS